jgi:hypothetical protein
VDGTVSHWIPALHHVQDLPFPPDIHSCFSAAACKSSRAHTARHAASREICQEKKTLVLLNDVYGEYVYSGALFGVFAGAPVTYKQQLQCE